jgi:hypothetical protein
MWRSILLAVALSGSQFILVTPGAHVTIGSHFFHRIYAEGYCGRLTHSNKTVTCYWAPKNWDALTRSPHARLARRPTQNHRSM